jgi:hypothetical protein
MRFWFVLLSMLLFALAVANAQTSSQSPTRECDTHGCCFPGSIDERCAPIEFEKGRRILQEDLQRRADEARKELERCIADGTRCADETPKNALQRCADMAGIKLFDVNQK